MTNTTAVEEPLSIAHMPAYDNVCLPGKYPCWEQYEWRTSQPPVKWVTDLAESLLRFRMTSLPSNPEIEDLQKVERAVNYLIGLLGARWRGCVREPFNFAPFEGITPSEGMEGSIHNEQLSMVLANLIGSQEPKPVRRR